MSLAPAPGPGPVTVTSRRRQSHRDEPGLNHMILTPAAGPGRAPSLTRTCAAAGAWAADDSPGGRHRDRDRASDRHGDGHESRYMSHGGGPGLVLIELTHSGCGISLHL